MNRIGVVFPGQGSQIVGMGADVAAAFPAAAALYREAKKIVGYDLLAVCTQGPEERLRETRYSQSAIFVTNLALRAALGEVLEPVASAGHSFGEFCSLTIAGAIAFESALALVNERGLAMQAAAETTPGAMAAVLGLAPEPLREAVAQAVERGAGRVQLANFNAPGQIVISGDESAVELAGELAMAAGAKRVVRLNVSGAWHSVLMEPAQQRFARYVEGATIVSPRFPVISNVDARPYDDVTHIKQNLVASVTHEVRWHDASLALVALGLDLIVEFGASPVLTPLIRRLDGAPKTLHVGDAAGVEKLRAQLASVRV